jgi:hypothetical protein
MSEDNIILTYRESIRKRERANADIKACEEEYFSLLVIKVTKDILQDPAAPARLNDIVESLIVQDNGATVWDKRTFKAIFKDRIEAIGDAFNVSVVIDGEKHNINIWDAKYEMQKRGEFRIKHKFKKVRETLNQLLPFLLYLSANFEKLNPRELRKTAVQKLSE